MDGPVTKPVATAAHWNGCIGFLGLLAIVGWQTWLTLGLFGADAPWQALLDDRPVMSGSHPQHLYLGTLGAQALAANGTICVYDPAFQAGYLKTPIFNGSRVAELCLFLGGGTYQPAIYKLGLLILGLLVPILLMLACFGAGLSPFTSLLAAATGILLSWGPSGRLAVEAGDGDLLLASLGMLAHAGMLVRFHRTPGFISWIGLWFTGSLIWFAQPLVFPLALCLFLLYYLCAGPRHVSFTWHGTLFLAQAAAVAVNLPWLTDWISFWWLRSPLPVSPALLPHRTLQTLWEAPLWGGCLDRGLALAVLGSAVVGFLVLHQQQRLASRLLALGTLGLLGLAFLGISWEPLGEMGTSLFFVPALWFAALPAAQAWTWVLGRLASRGLVGWLLLLSLLGALGFAGYSARQELRPLLDRCTGTDPLQIGLGLARADVVDKLVTYTSPDARILWEDRRLSRQGSRWSALLPLLTGRSFLGGLDPDAFIEPSSISFLDAALQGLPIASWTDDALDDYCKRYNIGWIVAWSPAVVKRFQEWPGATRAADLRDDISGILFSVKEPVRTITMKGKATLVHADWHHITLANVVPDNGIVVLSLHYQAGMLASPSRVQIEREPSGQDPIGFIRLRVAAPVARITLAWGNR